MIAPSKTTTEYLRYTFSEQELLEIARRSAQAQSQRLELLNCKAELMKDMAGRIAAQDSLLQKYAELLNQGYENRPIDCGVFYDQPEVGRCELVRLDTGEVISERRMDPDGRQRALDFKAPGATPDGLKAA